MKNRYCLGPLERGKDRMTTKSGLQRRQQRHTLFAQRRQIAANASNRDPAEMRQDPDGGECSLTSTLIHVIVSESRRARHVHPVAKALHMQPGFILMDHLALNEGLFDLLLYRGQLFRAAFDQTPDGAFTHDEFVSLRQLLPQSLLLFSHRDQFFFNRHALTLLGLTPFGKSPADLGSYKLGVFEKAMQLLFHYL